jgi:type I restriction enzyme, S subunit
MRENWIECSLIEGCDIHDNLRKPINSKERNERINGKGEDQLYPYYGATGQVGYIDDYLTEGEYVLIGEDAAPFLDYSKNVAYQISGKTWVNNHAHILKSKFNDKFLLHYLNQFNYRDYVSGTTRLKLTQGKLKQIPLRVAPLIEQRAIVAKIEELFSDLDKGINDLNKAQDQLKIYRQAVLKKAFEGGYSEDAAKELNRLGDHCKIVSGKAFKKSEYSDDGVRLFQIANVSFNKIVWDKTIHLPSSYLWDEKLKDLVLKEGDLVMALNRPMLNNELKIGVLGKSDVPSILYQRVGKFVFDSNINSKYLGYFFQSPIFIKWLSKELQGVNIPFINQSNLLGFSEFPYVDILHQNQIVKEIESRLSICDKVEESIKESLEKAKALRQSILKKAFEGKLLSEEEIANCKAEQDYEPASVLLKKIKNT